MAKTYARRKEIQLKYNGIEAGEDITQYLQDMTYDDATEESDKLTLQLSDREGKWLGDWSPQKTDTIEPTISLLNWNYSGEKNSLPCGKFVVDEFEFSGPLAECRISGVSAPVSTDFKETKNTKTWEQATIRKIVSEIAGKYGLELVYKAQKETQVKRAEQNGETDSAFIKALCNKYGIGVKIYASKMVVFDYQEQENAPPVATITADMPSKWSYRSTMQGTYTGARVSYADPVNKKEIEVLVGEEGRLCTINTKADDEADAQRIGECAIRSANRKENVVSMTIPPRLSIYATATVQLSGFKKLDGKYFVQKISHRLGKGAYTMQLTLNRIQGDDSKNKENGQDALAAVGADGAYTVEAGDTLWGIAKTFYGDGTKYDILYQANREALDGTAREHGKKDSEKGKWIYPGEKLVIPPKEGGTS